jgi:FlaG/FlaF family flagellin (archaellin)
MNARCRTRHAGWWLRIALASGLTAGALGMLALHSAPAEAAPAGSTTVLVGITTQSYPSFFRIAANGKSVQVTVIALSLNCTSGATFATPDAFKHVRISPNGNLQARVNIPPTAGSSGATFSGTDSMSAKLNRNRMQVAGVWELRLSYTFTNGTTDQCDSGPVRFVDSR